MKANVFEEIFFVLQAFRKNCKSELIFCIDLSAKDTLIWTKFKLKIMFQHNYCLTIGFARYSSLHINNYDKNLFASGPFCGFSLAVPSTEGKEGVRERKGRCKLYSVWFG